MLPRIKDGNRIPFRFEYTKEGIIQMAKNILDNKATISAKLKEMKKPTLANLELEKVRLYESLEGQPSSKKLGTYEQISNVLFRIEILSKISEMNENFIKIARNLSCEFDIFLAKALFLSYVIKGFELHLIVSLGENEIRLVSLQKSKSHSLNNYVVHLFKEKVIRFNLYIY